MATPATFTSSTLSFRSQESQVAVDPSGIVSVNAPMPFNEVDVSHLDRIVISAEWGEIKLMELLDDLYARFENASPDKGETRVIEVGSSGAYDAYNSNKELINQILPPAIQGKAKDIDLHPSFDRDLRYKVYKHVVPRAEEFFLAALTEKCRNFNRSKFPWREKKYDPNDNVFVLSIKDKNGQQYDFYFYEISKREFFASRDAAQLDLTPYVKHREKAKLVVHHFHALQPYVDRIERKLRIPEVDKVNHYGFLLQLYYRMKGYENPLPGDEEVLKSTLLKFLQTNNNLNDLISKFIANHPSDNAFAFIFSVRNRLGLSIQSPLPDYTTSQLRVCALLISPVERRLKYNGQEYFLDTPQMEDLKGFNWHCLLLEGIRVLDAILLLEEREPLNPFPKALFDSYIAALNEEERSSAYKRRINRFAPTERRSLVVMQTISSTKMQMPADLLSVVANHADESQYGLLIDSISSPEWIKTNVDKALKVFQWLIANKNADRVYPFLKGLIPVCKDSEIEGHVRSAWNIKPDAAHLLSLADALTMRQVSIQTLFAPYEEEMAPAFSSSQSLLSILGQPRTDAGKLALFRLLSKEDRLQAIQYAKEAGIAERLHAELLPLFRREDLNPLDAELIAEIAEKCPTTRFEQLLNYLPRLWMVKNPAKAEELFQWAVSENKRDEVYPLLRSLILECPHFNHSERVYSAWKTNPNVNELLSIGGTVQLPDVFGPREAEILPFLAGVSSVQFRACLGEPATNEGKLALYSILCRENAKEAIEFASRHHLAPEVVQQFLNDLEKGSDADRTNLYSYLSSLSYEERIAYWKNWLQKTKTPLESPLFPWVLQELKVQFNQSLFLAVVRVALPQAPHILTALECNWIVENPSIVARVIDLFGKDKSDAYSAFLRRLVAEDAPALVPAHIKRIWDIEADISALCSLQPRLASRGLRLSCVFPSMEKELTKPFGKALHEIKKQFDDIKFTRLVEIGHPNHIEALAHIAINHPEWISNHAEEAFILFYRLIEAGKLATLLQYMPILFQHGETSNIQESVKRAWPLIRKAKVFLELKSLLHARGVSLSVIFRPLEADVLKSIEELKEPASVASDFFGHIETPQGKKIYLSLLLRTEPARAAAYAKENRLEVDLLESSKEPLPVQVLDEKKEWNKEEIERLWVVAERTLDIPLIQALLKRSNSRFACVLKLLSANPASIKKAEPLYPHIIREGISTALPFILAQSQLSEEEEKEIPRLLKEGTLPEKVSLLKWIKALGRPIQDYVALDGDQYKEEYARRLENPALFEELYSIVGKGPFEKFWSEQTASEKVEIARKNGAVFQRSELRHLLNPVRDSLFSSLPPETLEKLGVEPSCKEHFLTCFRSPALFDRFYPGFYENFGRREKNNVSAEEYQQVLDCLIRYKSRHILTAMGYHPGVCSMGARTKEYIDAAIPHLGSMESKEENDFYAFAKVQDHVPYAFVHHFININNYPLFKDGLDFVTDLKPRPTLNDGLPLALMVLKGMVRFEKEFEKTPGCIELFSNMFTMDCRSNPSAFFECLKEASNAHLKQICFLQIDLILESWSKDPKKKTKKEEEAIGKYLLEGLTKDPQSTVRYIASSVFSAHVKSFPELNHYFHVAYCEILLKKAKASSSQEEKLNACNLFATTCGAYIQKNPESSTTLIDLYLSILSELLDSGADVGKLKFLCYAFLFMFINPEAISGLLTNITIPEIKTLKKSKNTTLAISYVTKLIELLLSKKYPKQAHLFFALDITNTLLLWLLGKASEYSKQILPLLERRIYFIPSTPEFHYSEFVINNQRLVNAADNIITVAKKIEYYHALNLKLSDASPKFIPDRVEGFNRYARNFLNHNCIRPALHVLNNLAEVLPYYKKNKDIQVREVFSGLLKRAEIDPKEPTSNGEAFLLKIKVVLIDYLKAIHELKDKEKYLDDYLYLMTELVKCFYKICERYPDYMSHYSDFLTMIEFENFINGHYEVYFDICDMIMNQWIKEVEDGEVMALDPMTVLILCQNEKIPDKHKGRQTQCLKKWLDMLRASKKEAYVEHIIEEYPAVTEIYNFKPPEDKPQGDGSGRKKN